MPKIPYLPGPSCYIVLWYLKNNQHRHQPLINSYQSDATSSPCCDRAAAGSEPRYSVTSKHISEPAGGMNLLSFPPCRQHKEHFHNALIRLLWLWVFFLVGGCERKSMLTPPAQALYAGPRSGSGQGQIGIMQKRERASWCVVYVAN